MTAFFSEFFQAVPWFLPGMALWTVAALALTPRFAGWLGVSRLVGLLVLVTLGFPVLATLTPTAATLAGEGSVTLSCDLDRIWLPSVSELLSVNDASRNVALFVPLGFALGWLPASRRSVVVVALLVALPIAIELAQLAFTGLGRGCQSADVVDNILGMAIGMFGAAALRAIWTRRRVSSRLPGDSER